MTGLEQGSSFITGASIASVGFLIMPMIKTPLHFCLISIFIGMAEAGIGPVPCTGAVSPLFDKKRGLAIGVMSTGVGVGGFIFSLLVGSLLIPAYGWQGGYYGIAAAHLLLIPLAMTIKGKKRQAALQHEESDVITETRTNELGSMLHSPSLWLIATIFFMFLFSLVGTVQIQAPHLQDIGFPVLNGLFNPGISRSGQRRSKTFFRMGCVTGSNRKQPLLYRHSVS